MSTPEIVALQAQITALQRQVASLQNAQGQPGESLTPNYLSVSPTGLITANFSGVFAGNLIIPESVSPFANPPFQVGGAVEWDEGGTHREFVQGTRIGTSPTTHILTLGTDADNPASQNRAFIRTAAVEAGAASAGSSYIALTAEDTVGGGFDDEVLIDSQHNSNIFKQLASTIQNNATGSLTNAPYVFPAANGCQIQLPLTLQLPAVVLVSVRCVIDVLTSSNAYVALTVSHGGVYDLRGSVAPPGGAIIATGTAGPNPPITSYLIASDIHSQPPITNYGASGSGDYSGIANYPFTGGVAQMLSGSFIPIFIPEGYAAGPTIELEYGVDAGGTYNVVKQSMAVIF